MKTLSFILIVLLAVIDFSFGQSASNSFEAFSTDTKIWQMASENYLLGLQRENTGVVESAMINLIKLRTVYPEGNYDNVLAELEHLQEEGKTKSIRVMAYITANYIKYPDRFTWLDQNNLELMDNTLATVSAHLKALDQ